MDYFCLRAAVLALLLEQSLWRPFQRLYQLSYSSPSYQHDHIFTSLKSTQISVCHTWVSCIAGRFYHLSHQGSLHKVYLTPLHKIASCLIYYAYNFHLFLVTRMYAPKSRSLCQFICWCIWGYISYVTQSCLTLCDPMNHSMSGLPVHHQLLEFTWTHVHWVGDAIQSSHPLLSPSPPAFNLSQNHSLFKWVSSSHQVAKVVEFQLQHQSFQWTPRTDFL